MRLTGWATTYSADDGLLPTELQDLDLRASSDELRKLARFLAQAADQLDVAMANKSSLNLGIDFSDDKPNAQTGIWVNVIHEVR